MGGLLNIQLADKAELDLFVAKKMTTSASVTIGNKERPAATRVYVGDSWSCGGPPLFYGNLYMPNGIFVSPSAIEIYGSIVAKGFDFGSMVTLHYDEAILDLIGCDDPPPTCKDCHQCMNPKPACKGGTCQPCSENADCCPPLVCNGGSCGVPIVE